MKSKIPEKPYPGKPSSTAISMKLNIQFFIKLCSKLIFKSKEPNMFI